MALVTIPKSPLMRLSHVPYAAHATVTLNNATASNNVFAAICLIPPGKTIDSVYIVGGGAPAGSPTYNVSIEGVTNSGAGYGGRPNGTPLTSTGGLSLPMVAESNPGAAVTSGAVVGHTFTDTYTNSTSLPQMVAITIRTGTTGAGLDAANTITIRAGYQTWITNFIHPHYSTLVSGSWAHTGNMPTLWASNSASEVLSNTSNVPLLTNETNWNSASSPNRRGIKWVAGFGCRLTGVNVFYRPGANTTQSVVVNVYESNGTTLKSTSTTSFNSWNAIPTNPAQLFVTTEVPATEIAAGDVVRIFLMPDATANSILQFYCLEWTASSQRNAFFETGTTDVFMYTASSDGTTWTDTNTKCAAIIPIIDQIEVSSGRRTVSRWQRMENGRMVAG